MTKINNNNKSSLINRTQSHSKTLITNQLTNKKIATKIAFHVEMRESRE